MKPQEFKGMGRSTTEPNARSLLGKYDERLKMTEICDDLELNEFLDKPFIQLTYGQLQRVLIASVALQKADVYIFDEPSSFLDVRERFKAARVIRTLLTRVNYVIVADHDLSLLDYLSNTVYCLHGKPGEYGILSRAYNARDGLNMFLTGFDPITSLRIRDDSLIFQVKLFFLPMVSPLWTFFIDSCLHSFLFQVSYAAANTVSFRSSLWKIQLSRHEYNFSAFKAGRDRRGIHYFSDSCSAGTERYREVHLHPNAGRVQYAFDHL